MRWQGFRRSQNVEDYTDPNKPVSNSMLELAGSCFMTIAEMLKLTNSKMAKDAGSDDIKKDT